MLPLCDRILKIENKKVISTISKDSTFV
jgi:hypothetical protein